MSKILCSSFNTDISIYINAPTTNSDWSLADNVMAIFRLRYEHKKIICICIKYRKSRIKFAPLPLLIITCRNFAQDDIMHHFYYSLVLALPYLPHVDFISLMEYNAFLDLRLVKTANSRLGNATLDNSKTGPQKTSQPELIKRFQQWPRFICCLFLSSGIRGGSFY